MYYFCYYNKFIQILGQRKKVFTRHFSGKKGTTHSQSSNRFNIQTDDWSVGTQFLIVRYVNLEIILTGVCKELLR